MAVGMGMVVVFGWCNVVRRLAGFFGGMGAVEDLDAGGGDAAAVGLFDLEGGAEVEGGGGVVEDLGVDSGVDEGCEEHVAADACEAVEVGDAHEAIVSWLCCGVSRVRLNTDLHR